MSQNKKNRNGIVFSTNPDFEYQYSAEESVETLAPEKQILKIWLERMKGGKEASVIKGFVGTASDLEDLAKVLKTKCGVGGTAKDNEIMIQGNHRDKILQILLSIGYKNVKKAGG